MGNLVTVRVIFRKNHFVALDPDLNFAEVNCERISAFTPRRCWLQRQKYTDGQILYNITYTEDTSTNALQGFWIEQDGEGMMIDVESVSGIPQSLVTVCNECCDSSPAGTITTHYNWSDVDTAFAFTTPTPSSYCIFRPGGTSSYKDIQKMVGDYVENADSVTFSSLSTSPAGAYYNASSYTTITPVGSDTITNGACA